MYEINKKSTRAEVLAAVKEDGYALSRANTKFRDDKVIVIASIKWNPESIKYASDRIKKDKKIILKTVSLNGNSLKYVSKELKKNKDIVQAAYKSAGEDVLEYADKGIKKKIITLKSLKRLMPLYTPTWKKIMDPYRLNTELV